MGIGFSLAEEFVKAGNEVIICGRREDKLAEAKLKLPQITTMACDVSKPEDRESLYNWAICKFPELNILVNNAGIQRRINFKKGIGELMNNEDEVDINLTSTIHSFSITLRHQLKNTPIKVFEIIPPIVDTDLDRGARGTENRGIEPNEVGVAALKAIESDEFECAVGMAQNLVQGAKINFDQFFNNMNH